MFIIILRILLLSNSTSVIMLFALPEVTQIIRVCFNYILIIIEKSLKRNKNVTIVIIIVEGI